MSFLPIGGAQVKKREQSHRISSELHQPFSYKNPYPFYGQVRVIPSYSFHCIPLNCFFNKSPGPLCLYINWWAISSLSVSLKKLSTKRRRVDIVRSFLRGLGLLILFIAGWSSPVARQAHNLKVVGSNPTPATKKIINGLERF